MFSIKAVKIINKNMGNIADHSITISVLAPAKELFNFQTDYLPNTQAHRLAYPSFIKKDQQNIQYCRRSNYNSRQYQIDLQQNDPQSTLLFTKLSQNIEPIWKLLAPNETIPLFQGCSIKLADTQFQVKKICRSFSQFEEWENLKTISDLEPRDSLNIDLANSKGLMSNSRSRRLQNSQFLKYSAMIQSRNLGRNQSKESFGCDGEGDFCRYCYGRENTSSNPLLNLCKCSGSVKFSHYFCLKNWISSRSITRASDCYEYFQYDLSCEVCKQRLSKKTMVRKKNYVLYSQSLVYPPFVVLSYKNEGSMKVRQYIITFDYSSIVKIGRGSQCDIQLPQKMISQEHCELIFENNEILLRSLNSTFGTFVEIEDEWMFSPVDNQLQVMIGNHLVRIQDESSGCVWKRPLQLKIAENSDY